LPGKLCRAGGGIFPKRSKLTRESAQTQIMPGWWLNEKGCSEENCQGFEQTFFVHKKSLCNFSVGSECDSQSIQYKPLCQGKVFSLYRTELYTFLSIYTDCNPVECILHCRDIELFHFSGSMLGLNPGLQCTQPELLTTIGNFSCTELTQVEKRLHSSSFYPTFRLHWITMSVVIKKLLYNFYLKGGSYSQLSNVDTLYFSSLLTFL
jgi:hypothetical protein